MLVRYVSALVLENLEAVVGWSRVFARPQIELTTELEAFCSTCVLINLDDIARVKMPKQRSALLVFLSKMLAVDRDTMSGTSPDTDIQLIQTGPVFVLLGQVLHGFGAVSPTRVPEDDESCFRYARIATLFVHNRIVCESSPGSFALVNVQHQVRSK